jgi:putative membrane protein
LSNPPVRPELQAQVYLAAERTFLAWIRTGLALMGFGFVVARFGLFLRELDALHRNADLAKAGMSVRVGTGLVVLGVVLTIAAVARYRRLIERLSAGEMLDRPSRLAVSLGIALAVLGALIAVYLLMTP